MPEDAFDILGLEPRFDVDPLVLDRRVRDLSRALHPDQHAGATAGQRRQALGRAIDVNEAHRALKDPIRRGEVLRQRLARKHGAPPLDVERMRVGPALLMEMMELREQLSEARQCGDLTRALSLAEPVRDREQRVLGELERLFAAALSAEADDGDVTLEKVDEQLSELRYLRRFLDEVAAMEDED